MGQHLEGVKGGVNHQFGLRHLALNGVGKAKEQGIARGKDNDRLTDIQMVRQISETQVVLVEDIIQRNGDVNPFRIFW